MAVWDAFRDFSDQVRKNMERGRADARRVRTGDGTTLPMSLDGLVRSFRADLEGEVARLLRAGRSPVDIGLGDGVDIPLLTDDLLAAHVELIDRRLVIARIRRTGRGFVVARDEANFGVFWRTQNSRDWSAVRRYGHVEGLHAGDVIGFGSCPADAITFALPSLDASPAADEGGDWRSDEQLRVAVAHWRYADITIGTSPRAVVRLREPHLAGAAVMLSRDLDRPEDGFLLRVLHPGPGTALSAPAGRPFEPLDAAAQRRFVESGYRLTIGDRVLGIPAALAPTPRFSSRQRPNLAEILEVFELGPHDLEDADAVKARYRELVRRFHPDRHKNPGHTSRFLEVQACWAVLQDPNAT